MRAPTYYQKCRDQQLYISRLEGELVARVQCIESLQGMVHGVSRADGAAGIVYSLVLMSKMCNSISQTFYVIECENMNDFSSYFISSSPVVFC